MSASDVPRTVRPIPHWQHVGLTTYDANDPDTSYPPITPLRPLAGAPNVLVVMLDDAGFGSSSAFGGPCATPTFERLAGHGLRFNRFHTTALCSPTRQAPGAPGRDQRDPAVRRVFHPGWVRPARPGPDEHAGVLWRWEG